MSGYRAADCQGFAGGFAVGVVQAGFELVAKRELPGGFASPSMDANRHILGDGWDYQEGESTSWDPVDAEFLFGNPPCSGFSNHSTLAYRSGTGEVFRGVDSPINACMWSFVDYAARVRPVVAAFESVPGAGKLGLPLMRQLVAHLRDRTGDPYRLYHVFHNNAAVGGAAIRPRYFWVASLVPFGIETTWPAAVPTLAESIGDLESLPADDPAPRAYRDPPTWWSLDLRSDDGAVDGHVTVDNAYTRRIARIFELDPDLPWKEGATFVDALRAYYERWGGVPVELCPPARLEKLIAKDWWSDPYESKRWHAGKAGRVVAGGFLQHVHPTLPRTFTYREGARIQGFPDDFRVGFYPEHSAAVTWLGKGIPVDAGRWLAGWVRAALDGNPGKWEGDEVGPDEFRIDARNDHKAVYDERSGARRDARSADLRRQMEGRPA